jgi:LysM repeat protein
MNFRTLFLAGSLAVASLTATAQSLNTPLKERAQAYVAKYKQLAMDEQRRTGIPAAIKLAQGIFETGAGSSELATEANNHFGIKCKKSWTGETFTHTDDAPDECFRKYASAEASYRDHSDYLKSSVRYASCFQQDPTDYAAWATHLRRNGYATNPKYAQLVSKAVEDYGLQQYTLLAMEKGAVPAEVIPERDVAFTDTPKTTVQTQFSNVTLATPPPAVASPAGKPSGMKVNDGASLQGFMALKGESLLQAATTYNIRYAKLLEWNDLADAPLPFDMFVYLEKKPTRGTHPTHTVKEGETLLRIAQEQGIQLRSLRFLNFLAAGDEPLPGTVLQLQAQALEKPRVKAQVLTAATGAESAATENTTSGTPGWIRKEAAISENIVAIPETAPERVRTSETAAAPPPVRIEKAAVENPVAQVAPVTPVVAAEAPTPAAPPPPAEPAAPLSAMDRLKAKMDKAVYDNSGKPVALATGSEMGAEVAKEKGETPPSPSANTKTGGAAYHTVAKGDTAFSIAKKYSISVTDLRSWNKLDFTALHAGQKLRVQKP